MTRPSGDQRGLLSPRCPLVIWREPPPATLARQMWPTRRPAFQSAVESTYNSWRPSGESRGSPRLGTSSRSMSFMGRGPNGPGVWAAADALTVSSSSTNSLWITLGLAKVAPGRYAEGIKAANGAAPSPHGGGTGCRVSGGGAGGGGGGGGGAPRGERSAPRGAGRGGGGGPQWKARKRGGGGGGGAGEPVVGARRRRRRRWQ